MEGIEDSVSIQVDEEDLSEDFVFTATGTKVRRPADRYVRYGGANEEGVVIPRYGRVGFYER